MLHRSTFLALAALIPWVQAQTATSTYVESAVPTGTPVPGDYTGPLRPQIHFSPPKEFMVSYAQSRVQCRGKQGYERERERAMPRTELEANTYSMQRMTPMACSLMPMGPTTSITNVLFLQKMHVSKPRLTA